MSKPLLAFVHIEKTGGTSFINILRQNHVFSHLDVRPFHKTSNRIFSALDLQCALRILPRLQCISGHSIKPHSDLARVAQNIRFVTLLRNPIDRCLSQYEYWVSAMARELSFPEFLAIEENSNFQTKKIAGVSDAAVAARILDKKFFAVGLTEQFDSFLMILSQKLGGTPWDLRYRRLNQGSGVVDREALRHCHADEIAFHNAEDLMLFKHVQCKRWPVFVHEYAGDLEGDVQRFRTWNGLNKPPTLKCIANLLFRKCILAPVTGIVRKHNGLSAAGDY